MYRKKTFECYNILSLFLTPLPLSLSSSSLFLYPGTQTTTEDPTLTVSMTILIHRKNLCYSGRRQTSLLANMRTCSEHLSLKPMTCTLTFRELIKNHRHFLQRFNNASLSITVMYALMYIVFLCCFCIMLLLLLYFQFIGSKSLNFRHNITVYNNTGNCYT